MKDDKKPAKTVPKHTGEKIPDQNQFDPTRIVPIGNETRPLHLPSFVMKAIRELSVRKKYVARHFISVTALTLASIILAPIVFLLGGWLAGGFQASAEKEIYVKNDKKPAKTVPKYTEEKTMPDPIHFNSARIVPTDNETRPLNFPSFVMRAIREQSIRKKDVARHFIPMFVLSLTLILAAPLIFLIGDVLSAYIPGVGMAGFLLGFFASVAGGFCYACLLDVSNMPLPGCGIAAVLYLILLFVPVISEYAPISRWMLGICIMYLGAIWVLRRSGKKASLIPEDFIDE